MIIGLLIVLALVTIMGTTYISADHAVVAHNLPWGVTGPSPLTTAVQKSISLDIHQYANQSDPENAANQAKIYGGFVPQSNTLILSVAASLRAPSVISAAYEKAAKQAGVKLQAKEINKFPSQDRSRHRPVRTAIGWLPRRHVRDAADQYGGSTPPSPGLARPRGSRRSGDRSARRPDPRRLPKCGEQLLETVARVRAHLLRRGTASRQLQSLIGTMGTLMAIILIVFIGNPSTGGGNGVAFLPPFWQTIGVVLPPRNGLYLIRNTLYFHGNSITQPIIVLVIYVLIGAVLVTVLSWEQLQWWRADKDQGSGGAKLPEVISPDEEMGTAAIPPG